MNNTTFLDIEKKKTVLEVIEKNNEELKRASLILGTHSALSAYLAQEAGADMLWFSGFEYSALQRLPDANILTMNECLSVARTLTDRVTIPVIADCDNGFGNAINAIRTAIEYQRAGFSGICIEDNDFPKRCSFYDSKERRLESIQTFCAKIKAVKDVINNRQHDQHFFIIARTEALILNKNNYNEAIDRLLAYDEAGADGLLLHYKEKGLRWLFPALFGIKEKTKKKIFLVPTTYNDTSYNWMYHNGVSGIILANYGIRACVKAMQQLFNTIINGKSLSEGNNQVVPMEEIFRIVAAKDLQENEARYVK